MTKKRKKLRGRVEKVIKSVHPSEPDKAQIEIEGADDLYKKIRLENVVTDETGKKDELKTGEQVDVTLDAESEQEEPGFRKEN